MLPYISGVNEDIRRVCSRYNLRVIFRSGQTLCTMLTRFKDRLPEEKCPKVVYWIPCNYGKVSIGETIWRLEIRLKEYKEAHRKADMKSIPGTPSMPSSWVRLPSLTRSEEPRS